MPRDVLIDEQKEIRLTNLLIQFARDENLSNQELDDLMNEAKINVSKAYYSDATL